MNKTTSYSLDADGIATLEIDVPGRTMNVLTPDLIDAIDAFADKLACDDAVRGGIITSGKAHFMAGADLKGLDQLFNKALTTAERLEEASTLSRTYRKLETCGKPVVAAINGTALGGGLEVCLACHYRVAADNPKAVIGLPEVLIGLLPGAGGTQRLPRLIGIQPALELMTQGTHLKPAQALEKGIVHEVVPPERLIDAAREWLLGEPDAEQPWDKKGFRVPGGAGAMHPGAAQVFMAGTAMTAKATQHNYPAPVAILSCVFEGTIVPIDTGLRIESKYFTSLFEDPVAGNMVRTLFINKQAADKLARRPEGIEKSAVTKLGMLGAGMMGAGIAYVTAKAGLDVVLLDTSDEKAEKGKDYSRALLQKQIDKGRMDADAARSILDRIHTTTDYADLAGCELIIEAVFEHRDIKADVTARTDAVIGDQAIFASNTSTLPITGLAQQFSDPARFIGLHFFSPVDRMPLVEVILGEQTSDECTAKALDYVKQIRKTPILVNDSRGFYTSRVFGTYTNEGMALLEDGVNPALIENAARQAGMAVGPLAVSDEVTLELQYKVTNQSREDLGEAYVEPSALTVVKTMYEKLERWGKRFGKGFYDYPEGGKKSLWPGLAEHWPQADEQPDVEEVKRRLLYIQALETARCFEEGVLTHPADADIGAIFGWGFPAWSGGTLSLIDTVGISEFVAECDRMVREYGPRFEPTEGLRDMADAGETYYSNVAAADADRSAA